MIQPALSAAAALPVFTSPSLLSRPPVSLWQLWEGAEASAGDLGARLAIVPMSQEVGRRGVTTGPSVARVPLLQACLQPSVPLWRKPCSA